MSTKKLSNALNLFFRDDIVKSGLIFLVASVVTAAFNYIYHLSMGRMLGPEEYGILGSLFAIVYIVLLSSTTIGLVVSKFTSELHGRKDYPHLKFLLVHALSRIIIFGGLGLLLYCLLSPLLAKFMHVEVAGVIIVGIVAFVSLIASTLGGALNGLQRFVLQNILGSSAIIIKLLLAVLLVYLGFGYMGALVAILIGLVLSIPFGIVPLWSFLTHHSQKKYPTKRMYVFALPVFCSSLLLTLIVTVDLVLVKHYFSNADAGYYAAAGMIAKIIWFGSSFLSGVLFPKVISIIAEGKLPNHVLRKVLAYTAVLVCSGCIVYFLVPELVVSLLYGREYLVIAGWIGIFGISLGLYSLSHLLVVYNLARERYSFILLLAAMLIFEVLAVVAYHSSLAGVVQIMLVTNVLLFGGLMILTRRDLVV